MGAPPPLATCAAICSDLSRVVYTRCGTRERLCSDGLREPATKGLVNNISEEWIGERSLRFKFKKRHTQTVIQTGLSMDSAFHLVYFTPSFDLMQRNRHKTFHYVSRRFNKCKYQVRECFLTPSYTTVFTDRTRPAPIVTTSSKLPTEQISWHKRCMRTAPITPE